MCNLIKCKKGLKIALVINESIILLEGDCKNNTTNTSFIYCLYPQTDLPWFLFVLLCMIKGCWFFCLKNFWTKVWSFDEDESVLICFVKSHHLTTLFCFLPYSFHLLTFIHLIFNQFFSHLILHCSWGFWL